VSTSLVLIVTYNNNGGFQFHSLHFLPLKMEKETELRWRTSLWKNVLVRYTAAIKRKVPTFPFSTPIYIPLIFSFFNTTTNTLFLVYYWKMSSKITIALVLGILVMFFFMSSQVEAKKDFKEGELFLIIYSLRCILN